MKIYVSNLADNVTEEDLQQTFSLFGSVKSVSLMKGSSTGHSSGLVEMPSLQEAERALANLNGKHLKGQTLSISQMAP